MIYRKRVDERLGFFGIAAMTFLLTSTCKRFEQTGRESIECLIVVSILRNPTLSEILLEATS
jgi:hypothetical protein